MGGLGGRTALDPIEEGFAAVSGIVDDAGAPRRMGDRACGGAASRGGGWRLVGSVPFRLRLRRAAAATATQSRGSDRAALPGEATRREIMVGGDRLARLAGRVFSPPAEGDKDVQQNQEFALPAVEGRTEVAAGMTSSITARAQPITA